MNTTNTLILIAVFAWGLQILLGWWQVSRFNKAFETLCRLGKVGIGRTAGRFKPKTLIAVAFDDDQRVVGAILMQGLTVFSRPVPIPQLIGISRQNIVAEQIFPNNQRCQEALKSAIQEQ